MAQGKRQNYLSWDETFMLMAELIAERSKDPSTQAGAVIVNPSKIIVGVGYNGFPRGIKDEELSWEREGGFLDTKYAYVVHAEENAIYNANTDTQGCSIYTTLFPCNECAKTLIQNGVKEIVFSSDKYHDKDQWIASRKMLDKAGITYRQYAPEHTLELKKNS
ncbi:MAG: cytidine deaminase [Candidatus Kerfeldbacteria bacterium CG08_land_8_20_14_0_20_42_7]|uniref:Cytidine deaminase n=1 Tax=Candidatus Kerfeldbacteria bacterium CG08_land_8_20_14_0_20_42_7 TaxID=2014245 RepID=A0A2H0YRV4_9BACT|nr:MAG: cytidine deaminase [Candidatus Kerfeldbacteria bacterium CG08_land_8_20_14_0_20_42_7]